MDTKLEGYRKDYINWDEYFMGIALLSAERSKDPKTQVGACIVSEDNRILSIGYNGFPNGLQDYEFPWNSIAPENYPEIKKDWYVVHSELNAILNYKGESLKGTTLYVTLFPCNECAKAIIQSGIKKVIYLEKRDNISSNISLTMMLRANIELCRYEKTGRKVFLEL